MSISSALSSALSGLNASARRADIVSSNIANAMTEGYGTRRLETAGRIVGNDGSGVRVMGVTRQEDSILIGQRRQADSQLGANRVQVDYGARLEALIGSPDQPGSLSGRLSDMEAKLISASNAPWNTTLLTGAVEAAQSLASNINQISSGIQSERQRADAEIGIAVDRINTALQGLDDLNKRILSVRSNGGEVASLHDAQAQLIDQISPYIPLQSRRETNGTLQIYSNDGHVLLSHRAMELGFDPSPGMDPFLSLANGNISGLTLDGRPLRLEGSNPALGGGELGALFDIRDRLGPEAQARIDAVARDLAERFDQSGLDPTIAPGDPGLFTDAGNLANPTNEVGLAGRLQVNELAMPSSGGAVWRLRDGLGAVTEGPSGNASVLTAQVDALTAARTTASGGFSSTNRTISELAAETLTLASMSRINAETSLSHTANLHSVLKTAELADGVDTDDELQRLLKIEQHYSANARVINVAEEMMDELLRIAQ
ncbi:flagellar hook-associated protein FlgK [Gymnodinialimonas hymeniacidonis]|uniref:flagellar hook-associated protein FlgK n=1 Tax=Gymnodinialimonas hymeniacidonis TaxID=3126508 RepID=UPI0034C6934B